MKIAFDAHTIARLILDPGTEVRFDLSSTPMSFRPEADWSVQSSGLPAGLVYFCRKGELRVRVGDRGMSRRAGQGIWIAPGVPFFLSGAAMEAGSVTRFRLNLRAGDGRSIQPDGDFWLGDLSAGGEAWLDLLQQEVWLGGERVTVGLRAALAGFVSRAFSRPAPRAREGQTGRRLSLTQVRDLLHWFAEKPSTGRPTLNDVAKFLRLSDGYTNTLFRQTFGFSCERWLIEQRVRAAARRLAESNLSVSEVAEEFGYASLYFFSRQFRAVMGCSPRAWRGMDSFR